jgi:hypothetical protein
MSYYIVSNSKLPDVLSPEVPKFYSNMSRDHKLVYARNNYWGDMKTPRISLFTSIDDAIEGSFLYRTSYALSPDQSDWFVYEVFMVQRDKLKRPDKTEEPLVQKVPIQWYTGRVKLKYRGQIEIKRVDAGGKQEGFPLTDKKTNSGEAPTLWLVKTQWSWISKA